MLDAAAGAVVFHAATGIDAAAIIQVQAQVCRRLLRVFVRRGLLPGVDAQAMGQWEHGGGFSVDGSVRIAATETLDGIARTLWPVPQVGDHAARQIGVVTGSLQIFPITWLAIRRLGLRGRREFVATGALWVVLMLAFEIVPGRAVIGFGWDRIGAEFDPSRGGRMLLGLAVLWLMPLFAARLHGLESTVTASDPRPVENRP